MVVSIDSSFQPTEALASGMLEGMRMRRSIVTVCVVLLAATCGTGPSSRLPPVSQADSIQLASAAFSSGSLIPARFTCDGQDVSPPLSWGGGPPAEEFALFVTDPDARGGEFVHWIVYAIPGTATDAPEGAAPAGAREGVNGFAKVGYGGPCPPKDDPAHHYVFTLYGLRVAAGNSLPPGASFDQVLDAIRCCIQSKGTLVGTYGR
jgi:Raf kinase inhibitor-like YbhB/YbcL family protein